jgi:uncharacterized membrane protein YphA (DoxX/SURF4 family)
MNVALWIVQGILSIMFLMAGGMKLFAYEKYKESAEKKSVGRGPGVSRGLTTFIGICEVAGGIGLILPMATGVAPSLTTLAALGLGIIMVLATIYHLRRKEPAFVPIGLLVLAALVVVGRGLN